MAKCSFFLAGFYCIRDLTKLRGRRAKQQLCTCITLFFTFLCSPCITRTRERQGDKFYHLCQHLGAVPSLQLQPKFPWNNREKKWKDAESISQRRFHGRRRCRIVRSLLVTFEITLLFLLKLPLQDSKRARVYPMNAVQLCNVSFKGSHHQRRISPACVSIGQRYTLLEKISCCHVLFYWKKKKDWLLGNSLL